jgi:hypothetical protein
VLAAGRALPLLLPVELPALQRRRLHVVRQAPRQTISRRKEGEEMSNFAISDSDGYELSFEDAGPSAGEPDRIAVLSVTTGDPYVDGTIDLSLDNADALAKELARRVTDEKVRRAELARKERP